MRHLSRVPAAAVLLVLGFVATACGVRTHRFEFPQRVLESRNVNVYPWRVAVVAGPELTPYRITFRYWSTISTHLFCDLPDDECAGIVFAAIALPSMPVALLPGR